MSNVFFASDLHIGHKNIATTLRGFDSIEEHDETLIENWNKTVNKHDKVFLLGDLSLHKNKLPWLGRLRGRIAFVGGNHDNPSSLFTNEILKYVSSISGMIDYKGYFLTHAPIHPDYMRGRRNIHGHLHELNVKKWLGLVNDSRYINVSMEQIGLTPISFDEIQILL